MLLYLVYILRMRCGGGLLLISRLVATITHLICCWLAYKFTLFLFVYRVHTHAEQCSLNMFAVAASLHCFYIINPCILYCIRHSVHVNVHQLHTARCACTCSYMCFNYYQYKKFFNLKTRVDYLQHTADHQQHCRLSLQTCSTVNGWGRGGAAHGT